MTRLAARFCTIRAKNKIASRIAKFFALDLLDKNSRGVRRYHAIMLFMM